MTQLVHDFEAAPVANTSTSCDFARLSNQLSLADLVATFSQIAEKHGIHAHYCYEPSKKTMNLLFGSKSPRAPGSQFCTADPKSFSIRHWDDREICLQAFQGDGRWSSETISQISLLATIYIHQALTLMELDDEVRPTLSEIEKHCLAHHLLGQSHLAIGEGLGISAPAVALHFRRAARKLNCPSTTAAASFAAASGQLAFVEVAASTH